MNLADVFTVTLVVLGLLTVFVGWWLATAGLFPRMVEGCADRLGTAPWKTFFVGLIVTVPVIFGAIMIGKVSPNAAGKLLSSVLIIVTVLLGLTGAAGLALRIGRGLGSERDAVEPWRRVRRGAVVLAITYGTIVLLPVTLVAGLGAIVLGWVGAAPMRAAGPADGTG